MDHPPRARDYYPDPGAFIHPDWVESPAVQAAIRASHWPDCTSLEFFEALHQVLEVLDETRATLERELSQYGLSVGEVLELAADVRNGEPEAEVAAKGAGLGIASKAGRGAVRKLYRHGLSVGAIAEILGLDLDTVARYVDGRQLDSATSKQIILAHLDGKTPHQIAKALGRSSRGAVYDVLRDAGYEPHRERTFLSEAEKADIVQAYRDGRTFGEISEWVGVTTDQAKNACRAAHKKGLLPEYGTRRAS